MVDREEGALPRRNFMRGAALSAGAAMLAGAGYDPAIAAVAA